MEPKSGVLHRSPPLLGYSPYTSGSAKQELRDEAVQLAVELSLYVAESMFLLCDDIRSVSLFCYTLWSDATKYEYMNPDSPVVDRLLLVIHYVFFNDIKPKNGVYQNGRKSVQWKLIRKTWKNFGIRIIEMDLLVFMLAGEESTLDGRHFLSRMKETLNKVEEKLRCAKAVSEANGFVREALEPNILELWKSVFDKEAKEAKQTLEVINNEILLGSVSPSVQPRSAATLDNARFFLLPASVFFLVYEQCSLFSSVMIFFVYLKSQHCTTN